MGVGIDRERTNSEELIQLLVQDGPDRMGSTWEDEQCRMEQRRQADIDQRIDAIASFSTIPYLSTTETTDVQQRLYKGSTPSHDPSR